MTTQKTWRDRARPVVAEVIAANAGKDEKAIRKALRKAYPWGQRSMHPYRIWCDEVNRQMDSAFRPIPATEQIDVNGLPLFDCSAEQGA